MASESTHPATRMEQDLNSHVLALHSAVDDLDERRLKELLTDCDTPKLFDAYRKYYREPVLYEAIASNFCHHLRDTECSHDHGSIEAILEELVTAGAEINEPGYVNPVMFAIRASNLGICKLLVKLGADLTQSYFHGGLYRQTPLSLAACAGRDFVAFLLEHIGLTERDDKVEEDSPLYNAAVHGTTDVLIVFMNWYETMDRQFPWKKVIESAFLKNREDSVVAVLQQEYHLWDDDHDHIHDMCFKRALGKKCTKIMRLLVQQEPHIVHKAWMSEISIPDELNSSSHNFFQSWLRSFQSQPFPLQLICRCRILRQLGPKPEALINQLPLPNLLKDYLKKKNVL